MNRKKFQNQITQENFDNVVKNHYFKIRARHAVSPLPRVIKDFMAFKSKKFEAILKEDWKHQIYLKREPLK